MARPMSTHDPVFLDLPPCMRRVGYWLLLLTRPGQTMTFIPAEMGVKAETVQQYVYEIGEVLGRRYKMIGGVSKDAAGVRKERDPALPLGVVRIS